MTKETFFLKIGMLLFLIIGVSIWVSTWDEPAPQPQYSERQQFNINCTRNGVPAVVCNCIYNEVAVNGKELTDEVSLYCLESTGMLE